MHPISAYEWGASGRAGTLPSWLSDLICQIGSPLGCSHRACRTALGLHLGGVTPMLGTERQTAPWAPKTVAPLGAHLEGTGALPPRARGAITVPVLAVDGSWGGPERVSWECEKPRPRTKGLRQARGLDRGPGGWPVRSGEGLLSPVQPRCWGALRPRAPCAQSMQGCSWALSPWPCPLCHMALGRAGRQLLRPLPAAPALGQGGGSLGG